METHTLEYHLLSRLHTQLSLRSMGKAEYNIGAIVTDKKGKILSYGFNSYTKTHPKQYYYNKDFRFNRVFLHAEISSLIRCASSNSKAHTMIIARLGKDNKLHMSKPCEGCYKAILDSGIKKVYYTDDTESLVLLNLNETAMMYN